MGKKSFSIVEYGQGIATDASGVRSWCFSFTFWTFPGVLLLERVSASSVFTGTPNNLCLFAGSCLVFVYLG